MVAGDDEDELLSVSIQRSQHSTEDDLASNRPSKQSEATAISMSSLATTTNAVSDQNIAAEQEANGTFKTLESSSPSKPSVMFADSSIIRDHHVNSREISQSSPTSPIFSNTLQHRKIQDAQQLANRLMMKRNKILDHFARSSALLTKNFIRMWRNLPVMLFTAFIPGLQCKLVNVDHEYNDDKRKFCFIIKKKVVSFFCVWAAIHTTYPFQFIMLKFRLNFPTFSYNQSTIVPLIFRWSTLTRKAMILFY